MNIHFPSPKPKPRFYQAILTVGSITSRAEGVFARWNRFTYRRALQRLEHLNDHALHDIGLWREPGSRVDEWWMMNPPP